MGTITRFSSYAVGKLVTEPPHTGTLTALLASLKAGSALAGAEAWPDPNVAGEAANYTLLTANMTALCRFVMLQKDTAARRELAYVGAAGTADDAALRSREEEEKKNHKAKAAELAQLCCWWWRRSERRGGSRDACEERHEGGQVGYGAQLGR